MATESHQGGRPEVVVCITHDAIAAVSPVGDLAVGDADEVNDALRGEARLLPLFSEGQAQLRRLAGELRPRLGFAIPDLSRFYCVEAEWDGRHEPHELAANLDATGLVEAAYVKAPPEAATRSNEDPAPQAIEAEPRLPTPDFTALQGYLGAAPLGIDAFFAWTVPGGYGQNVRIVDIEEGYRCTHEDLIYNHGGMLNRALDDRGWRNHGTAVAGILGGDFNTFGVTGICPGATFSGMAASGERGGSAAAIRRAADRLDPGDIVLIELHTAGPITMANDLDTAGGGAQVGYVALEYWPDDFAAIRYATERGVIVVAAAGNGGQDLGQLDELHTSSGTAWANPFDRVEADSGAILVGAGGAPGHSGRSRLGFSNWGACIDAQGWGELVVTTGGKDAGRGDLQGGRYEDRWYTKTFGGTSSAAPMVAGALACVQGVLREAGQAPLSPAEARALLRETGSPQAFSAHGAPERIGSLPNLMELIPRALASTGGPAVAGYVGPPSGGSGMRVAVLVDDGGGTWQNPWDAPHWRGPHWRGPHWRGPHWRGPSWDGRPYEVEARPVVPRRNGEGLAERREVRRPGFSS